MGKTATFTQSTVISTRIRLARNVAAYPFPEKLSHAQAQEIVRAVRYEIDRLDDFKEYDIAAMPRTKATYLQEKHLISPALVASKRPSAAFIDEGKTVSVMVNEEDHLREQYILKGFDLYKAYERINELDDFLGSKMNFAYDDRLGYLTACPTNLGTGMRASVMMFLPGLAKEKKLEKMLPKLKSRGMTVRGVFGEGTAAEGYLYQVSNERTLGVTETDILSMVEETAAFLGDMEEYARTKMLQEDGLRLKDRCLRAYGTICNCAALPQDELSSALVKVRLGLALGFLETKDKEAFDDFVDGMRPASFELTYCEEGMDETAHDERRADVVGELLPELVKKTVG